ncbi:MAG: hypothetical protein WC315_00175 [Candidatus Omnitrophota bacterium]|jgi:hypothetical protein
MNLVDQLLQHAEGCAEKSETSRQQVSTYQDMMDSLPRLFPAPDDMYVRSPDIEYDLALFYSLQSKEQDDALRMVLSMTFGALEWEGEIDKAENTLTLRTLVKCGEYTVLIKIIGANHKHYHLTDVQDVGLKLVGRATSVKFVPWEILRPDITPEILLEQCVQSNAVSYVSRQQAKILSELAAVLPPNVPAADGVSATLGLSYDADITYLCDPSGKKRAFLDKYLGYNGWSATIQKRTADFSLHTIFEIRCKIGKLRLRVSIVDACKDKEQLFLVGDLPELLVYKAVRSTDPDYKATLKMFKTKYGY